MNSIGRMEDVESRCDYRSETDVSTTTGPSEVDDISIIISSNNSVFTLIIYYSYVIQKHLTLAVSH